MLDWFKRHQKGLVVSVACIMAVAIMITVALQNYVPITISQKSKEVKVKISDTYNADLLNNPTAKVEFRSDAKFKILEIVPYRGMAEIGYGIAGEEPVDISRISKEDAKGELAQILHNNDTVMKWDDAKNQLVNQNSFLKTTLKEALQLTAKQVKNYEENHLVDVLVVEPAQINAHPELIDESDYISIHDDFAKGNNDYFNRLLYLYEKYSYAALTHNLSKTYYNSGNYPTFKGTGATSTDITMEVVAKLYNYGMIDEYPLTIPGYTLKEELSGRNNVQKLGYAISVSTYLQSEKYKSAIDCYKKLFVDSHENGWSFWTIKNLVHYLCPEKSSEWDDMVTKVENGYSESVDNYFVGKYYDTTICAFAHGSGEQSSLLSKLSLQDSFKGKIDTSGDEKWCEGVNNDSRDVSVTIYNAYCPEMTVLDVEPDNKFTLSTLDVKSWIPAEIRVKVSVVKMTMSEFVGIVNDLNSDYDMIYFGKNVNKMQGDKLYYTGVSATSTSLSGVQGSGVNGSEFKYSGNDITERMMEKVDAYMDAGYPVAYEPDLIVPEKINTDTKIFDFLKKHSKRMYTVTDGKTLSGGTVAGFLNHTSVKLGKLEITETLSSTVHEYQTGTGKAIGADGLNGLEIYTRNGSGAYRAYLYIDSDHNGIFNEWVNNNGSYSLDDNYENAIWSANFTAGETVTVSNAHIPSSAMLGTVSYKIEIVKLSGGAPTGIRTNLTGHVKVNESVKKIRVLQLSDLTSYPKMDLSSDSSEATRFKNYALSSVVTDLFKIDVTAKDITKTDFDEADLFLPYDVIIVGFIDPAKKLADPDGLLNKLKNAASKGKGVIFTRDVLSYYNDSTDADHWGNNMNYKVRKLLGMDRFKAFADDKATAKASEMGFTYSVLNKFCGEKYFSGLTDEITSTDTVARINDAKIGRYPYVIEIDKDKKTNGFKTKSGIYQVDVNQTGSEVVNGVGYFCLDGYDSEKNYSVSPKDIRNNYYLWRNDTVFYSGISHESFGGSYDKEIQLFVNTIISAYGLERSVNIDVKNLYTLNEFADGKAYMLYCDVDFSENSMSGSKAVNFDLSIKGMKNPEIKIRFYKADGEGNKVSDPLELNKSGNKFSEAGSEATKATEFVVSTGTEYVYKYPFEYLDNGTNQNIRIEATATEKGKTATDTVLIKALRRSMFDLD